jgi:hypothetical protein
VSIPSSEIRTRRPQSAPTWRTSTTERGRVFNSTFGSQALRPTPDLGFRQSHQRLTKPLERAGIERRPFVRFYFKDKRLDSTFSVPPQTFAVSTALIDSIRAAPRSA